MTEKEHGTPPSGPGTQEMGRRAFVKLLPAGAASLAAIHVDVTITEAVQQPRPPQPPQRVSKEMLHAAEELIGIELNDAQETMALRGVNQNLNAYEMLRKIDVPLDTEPATAFHPALPGKKFDWKPVKFKLTRQDIPHYNSIEDVAFFTATQLAGLLRTRQVSSVDLTRMYLARLKRYGPKLLFVFVSPAPGSASLLVTNLTGHPQVCVPCGFIDGLSRSIMFTGRLYDEGAPLRVALAYERASNWRTMRPKMDWA